jgi:2-C-methyl-D-erythritol 4-phosphate cytidylyltransferase/2-C-methyl-D-erythritol 2,4-cyclodiphosphate synthase
VAAGRGARFGGDKLAARLGARTVLEHAVGAVRAPFPKAPVVLVVRPDAVDDAAAVWRPRGVRVVAGGERRQDSVRNGVEALALGDDAVVVIHDAARPFVPPADVVAVAAAALETGAALLVAPVVDTVKRLGGDGTVAGTVPREGLVRALTPQAFTAATLRRAWAQPGEGPWTDTPYPAIPAT